MYVFCNPDNDAVFRTERGRILAIIYRGADKSSARPARKQATATEDFDVHISYKCRSQWPCRLRRRSAATRLLRLWVRIPPGAYIRRAQVKVGLINLCKGLFSLNARIHYKLKSGT